MSMEYIHTPEEAGRLAHEELLQSYGHIYASYSAAKENAHKYADMFSASSKKCVEMEEIIKETKDLLERSLTAIEGLVTLAFPKKSEASRHIGGNDGYLSKLKESIKTLLKRISRQSSNEGCAYTDQPRGPAQPKGKIEEVSGKESGQQESGSRKKNGGSDGETSGGKSPSKEGQNGQTGQGGKKRGRSNIQRQQGFIEGYFTDFSSMIVKIDGISYTMEEAAARLGVDDLSKIFLKPGDTDYYITAEYIAPMAVPCLHISTRLRSGDSQLRSRHSGRIVNVSAADVSFLAHIINMYLNLSVPLYRQEKYEWPALGLNLSDSTVSEWLDYLCNKVGLKCLFYHMLDYIKSRVVKIGDETFIVCKEKPGMSYYWVIRTSPLDKEAVQMVSFIFNHSHSALVPLLYFDGMAGYFLTDGNETYPAFVRQCEDLVLANCWHHSRRPLKKIAPSQAEVKKMEERKEKIPWSWEVYTLIGDMFTLDRGWKDKTSRERLALRNAEMKPLAEKVFRILKNVRDNEPEYKLDPDVQKAVNYILEREGFLMQIFENGDIPLSTNDVERDNIMVALFRNNSKAFEKARRAFNLGILASIVGTVREHGTDIESYLHYLLWMAPTVIGDDTIGKVDSYWEAKEKRFMEAMQHVHARPSLDFSDLEKPDLSYLSILMDDSNEYKAFLEERNKWEADRRHYTCRIHSLLAFRNSPISSDLTARVVDALLKKEEMNAEIRNALEIFKKDVASGSVLLEDGYLDQEKYMNSPVKGIIFPEHNLYWSTLELIERQEKISDKAGAGISGVSAPIQPGNVPSDIPEPGPVVHTVTLPLGPGCAPIILTEPTPGKVCDMDVDCPAACTAGHINPRCQFRIGENAPCGRRPVAERASP